MYKHRQLAHHHRNIVLDDKLHHLKSLVNGAHCSSGWFKNENWFIVGVLQMLGICLLEELAISLKPVQSFGKFPRRSQLGVFCKTSMLHIFKIQHHLPENWSQNSLPEDACVFPHYKFGTITVSNVIPIIFYSLLRYNSIISEETWFVCKPNSILKKHPLHATWDVLELMLLD